MSDDIRDKIRIFQEVVQGKRPACELKAILPDEVPTMREINWMRFAMVDMFAAMSCARIGGNSIPVPEGATLDVGSGSGALEYVRGNLYGYRRVASETDCSEGLPGVSSEAAMDMHIDPPFACSACAASPPDGFPRERMVGTPLNSWTCDNHTEPITYTDGTTECYCGNARPKE